MNRFRLFAVIPIFLVTCCPLHAANTPAGTVPDLSVASSPQDAQSTAQQPVASAIPNPVAAVSLLSKSFSSDQPISAVSLTGSATWNASGKDDAGPVSFSVSSAGGMQLQILLQNGGSHTESSDAVGPEMSCSWSDADAKSHALDAENCWKPVSWFLPQFFLQSILLSNAVQIQDLGNGMVGDLSCHHLRAFMQWNGSNAALSSEMQQRSTVDLGLDPATSLPIVLSYVQTPDNGSDFKLAVLVKYSDYRVINGATLPFRIQRFVNGAPQMDATIQTATIQ